MLQGIFTCLILAAPTRLSNLSRGPTRHEPPAAAHATLKVLGTGFTVDVFGLRMDVFERGDENKAIKCIGQIYKKSR